MKKPAPKPMSMPKGMPQKGMPMATNVKPIPPKKKGK